MSDLFTTDELNLTPNFGSVSHSDDLVFSLSTHENYYENSIFLNTDNEAEMLIVEGNSKVILDSHNSVSLLDGSEFSVSIENGTHDMISINGSIELLQNNGHSLLYVEDFSNTSGFIKIETGSFTIVNADTSKFSGEPSVENGQLFIGDSQTNYFIEANDQENVEILFRTVSQDSSNTLMLEVQPSSAPSKTTLEISEFENENSEIFSENSVDISGYSEDYAASVENIGIHNVNGHSFEAEINGIIDEINQDIMELEISSADNDLAKIESTEITMEKIIEVSSYSDLEWQDAIEIIGDL